MRTFVMLLALVSASSVAPSFVSAQEGAQEAPDSDAKQRASEHFRRGVELFHEGAFRASQVEFQRAYEIAPDYRLLYNIGQAQLQLHDYLGAHRSYERYLIDGASQISAERRQEVEAALQALRERVAKLSIQVSEDGAEVYVDDQRVGVSPLPGTVSVNVGRHRVYARTPRGGQAEIAVDVAGGDLKEVMLTITAADVPTMPIALSLNQSPEPASKGLTRMQRTAVVAWAAGGAAVIGSVVSGVLAGKKSDELDAELAKKPPEAEANPRRVKNLRDSADTLALTTDVLAGTAIALIVTGAVLWLVGDRGDDADRKAALLKPDVNVSAKSVGLTVTF